MKAVLVKETGGAEQLYLGEVRRPVPGPDELLVRVAVAALNRADLLQREGKYPPPAGASPVLGLEFSGSVEEIGSEVIGWSIGEGVFGLVPGGAQAEWVVIHKKMALRMPAGMSFEECAAIPEVFLTAFQALVWLGEIKKGEKVLIHAGASGVGTAAIQLTGLMDAAAFVSASAAKHRACLDLGAAAAVDYRAPGFWEMLREVTGGADIIIDPVAGEYFPENLKLLNTDGRLVMLAVMGGARAGSVDVGRIVFKRLKIMGSTLRSRPLAYQAALTRAFWEKCEKEFAGGSLKPVIDRVFDWKEIREAHRYMEANLNIGKVLLKVT
ncbi:MAG: NADPH:quinone oxidoreductase [Cytophagaceae bacterium SCN 52-12]|nr:MAG: NADPH:quinone oxidoreductase [Cytophagaceae bacterium SCN 52-12]